MHRYFIANVKRKTLQTFHRCPEHPSDNKHHNKSEGSNKKHDTRHSAHLKGMWSQGSFARLLDCPRSPFPGHAWQNHKLEGTPQAVACSEFKKKTTCTQSQSQSLNTHMFEVCSPHWCSKTNMHHHQVREPLRLHFTCSQKNGTNDTFRPCDLFLP